MIKRTHSFPICTIGDAELRDRQPISSLFHDIAGKTKGVTALERAVWNWQFTDRGLQDRLEAQDRYINLVAEDGENFVGLAFATAMSGHQHTFAERSRGGPNFLRLNWIGIRQDWRHHAARLDGKATLADMMITIVKSRLDPAQDFIDACVQNHHPIARELLERNGFVPNDSEKVGFFIDPATLKIGDLEENYTYYRYTP
ncbi:MAG TPA: hypothetical protein VIN59_06900 [Alphaproteobacteria bacterium]